MADALFFKLIAIHMCNSVTSVHARAAHAMVRSADQIKDQVKLLAEASRLRAQYLFHDKQQRVSRRFVSAPTN